MPYRTPPRSFSTRIERWDWLFLAALAAGAVLLFAATPEPLVTVPRPALGNALALAAGITWALSLAGLRWITVRAARSGEEPFAVIVAGCLLAFAVAAAASWPELPFPPSARTLPNAAIILYLGVCQIGLAYLFVTRGMRQVTAIEASLLLLTEPVFTLIWAWLVLGETPTLVAVLGGALIVAAAAVNTLLRGVSSAPRAAGSV